MNKKGKSTRLDMNDFEKKFLDWYKNKFPTHKIEKNTKSFVIWEGKRTPAKISYTPDFYVENYADKETKYIELKGWSPNDKTLWPVKRKLVVEFFTVGIYCEFIEYRDIGKEFFEYDEWIFIKDKNRHIKKYEKTIYILNNTHIKVGDFMHLADKDTIYQTGMPVKVFERKLKHNTKMLALWKSKVWAE